MLQILHFDRKKNVNKLEEEYEQIKIHWTTWTTFVTNLLERSHESISTLLRKKKFLSASPAPAHTHIYPAQLIIMSSTYL